MSDTVPIEHQNWLKSGDFTAADEPLRLFAAWFEDAKKAEPNDPEAMALATVDAGGQPNVRMVLLKGVDERGFVFYTNAESRKGEELAAGPRAGHRRVFHQHARLGADRAHAQPQALQGASREERHSLG